MDPMSPAPASAASATGERSPAKMRVSDESVDWSVSGQSVTTLGGIERWTQTDRSHSLSLSGTLAV